ncbi:MAG TPA: PaaX family transcriptional regulator C-terminal domain-containing protein, partial [Steroidobacter sp.]|nr:PaaX family transcriptional regulator C-terminal domain-containing protein [Steroidobacter sp.]
MSGRSARFATRTEALAARFRRQRPLRAGSLLVTILGDAIAPRGGTIALASLIELARPFGLTERLVRTSVGRLGNEGWVNSERRGRVSYYSLTPVGRARFAEATQRIYAAPPGAWDRRWTLILIPPALKKAREKLRQELSWHGFGEVTRGVFAHPTHKEDTIRARLAELESTAHLIVVQGAVVSWRSDAQLVAMGWDFAELSRRYQRFIKTFAPVDACLRSPESSTEAGQTAFTLRTLLLHEYRKIHLRDPLLPASLLPQDWV